MANVITLPDDPNRDLGLGARVAQQSRTRFLNRDGTFNVRRTGFSFLRSLSLYHKMLTISWPRFFLIILAAFVAANLLFAWGYLLCGAHALHGARAISLGSRFVEEFFFSVQTCATIGYGRMSPDNLAANVLVTVEALTGLLGLALATGLLFARFSRPTAKVIFSKHAVVAPYRDITALEFRIANERSNELMEVRATVVLTRFEERGGVRVRRFHPLALERSQVVFMPLHWVIVHPIDAASPLHGVTAEAFADSDAEILILLTGVDETFAQTVHVRSSYKHEEVQWGARFGDVFVPSDDERLRIDLRRIDDVEIAGT